LETLKHEVELWKSSYMTAQKNVSRMEVEKRKIELELEEIKEKMGKLVEEKEVRVRGG
jgi:hypothetical protein